MSISAPRIESVVLRDFSLYRNRSSIDLKFGNGVFCLAGANGLGKSTFLSAIGFGLTGVVADPTRTFRSVDEYYRHSLPYSQSHFSGRIEERERDSSEIEIAMTVGSHRYTIVRNMFEPQGLRSLSIIDSEGTEILPRRPDAGSTELHRSYAEQISSDVGLQSFDQFVFLHHFLFTFDERRHLLFWDSKIASQVLYLAFGLQPHEVKLADKLEREIERSESQARNLQYQATTARRSLKELRDMYNRIDVSEEIEAVEQEHDRLSTDVDRKAEDLRSLRKASDDAQLELTTRIAAQISGRASYEALFASRLAEGAGVVTNPLVSTTLSTGVCAVCGTAGQEVTDRITHALRSHACPLCGSHVREEHRVEETLDELRAADSVLALATEAVEDGMKTVQRLTQAVEHEQRDFAELRAKLDAFEESNVLAATGPRALQSSSFQAVEEQYIAEIENALVKKNEFRTKRDTARKSLRAITERFARAYASGQTEFVPIFRELAEQFLGLNLDLVLDYDSNDGVELVLTLEGTKRRAMDQLSESQRYFIDIALRMALAKYMTQGSDIASLYIDTPEGSLDIAYEARAGAMFAAFVQSGNRIVMTANINTSQLLLQLARVCGNERMILARMTDWTALSQVQSEAEPLFDQAFSDIEAALDGSDR